MRLRFITSTPLDVRRGSGTFVGIATLARAVETAGVKVDMIAPRFHLPVYSLERVLFNESLRFRRFAPCDASIGFDLDGYAVTRGREPHLAAIKGVIADELQFERGVTRASMAMQAYFERLHVCRASRVMTTSHYAALRLHQLYRAPHVQGIVPELIDLTGWREVAAANPAQPDPQRFTVLCVCRLYPRKRVDALLRAAAALRARIPNLAVRIIGNGPQRESLHTLWRELGLEATVEWLGDVSQAQLAAAYQRANVFCLPSVQEGFGIVFLEAMAMGCPIVATRASAVPEVVRHGVLVEPESDGAIADGIYSLYADERLCRNLAAESLEYVRQFDAPNVARLFLNEVEAGIDGTRV